MTRVLLLIYYLLKTVVGLVLLQHLDGLVLLARTQIEHGKIVHHDCRLREYFSRMR